MYVRFYQASIQRKKTWNRINLYITDNGGHVTYLPSYLPAHGKSNNLCFDSMAVTENELHILT